MKRFFTIIMYILIFLFLIVRCQEWLEDNKKNDKQRKEKQREEYLESKANEVIKNILYIKDSRTGLCFAFYSDNSLYGGPSLTTVPCDSVPEQLLRVVYLKKD